MSVANLSVRADADLKKDVEHCLDDIGLNISTTVAAIEEGERIAHDPNVKGYQDMNSLIEALNS